MSLSLLSWHVDQAHSKVDAVHDTSAHPVKGVRVERCTWSVGYIILGDGVQEPHLAQLDQVFELHWVRVAAHHEPIPLHVEALVGLLVDHAAMILKNLQLVFLTHLFCRDALLEQSLEDRLR